jgi:hypothetical protein
LLDDGAIEIWLLKKLQESSFMITDPELLSVRAQMATLVIAYQADRSKNCLLMKKITAMMIHLLAKRYNCEPLRL